MSREVQVQSFVGPLMEHCAKEADVLGERLTMLEERLSVVLGQPRTKPDDHSTPVDDTFGSPLAHEVSRLRHALRNRIVQVEELIERIEV